MSDEIRGEGFVMRPAPDASRMSGKEYARAWLLGEVELFFNGKTYVFPTREDMMSVLREDPGLVERVVSKNPDIQGTHDVLFLEQVADGYDVYYTDRGAKADVSHFDDLWSALDAYWRYWGLR